MNETKNSCFLFNTTFKHRFNEKNLYSLLKKKHVTLIFKCKEITTKRNCCLILFPLVGLANEIFSFMVVLHIERRNFFYNNCKMELLEH